MVVSKKKIYSMITHRQNMNWLQSFVVIIFFPSIAPDLTPDSTCWSCCHSLLFPLLSPSLSLFCQTATLILRHTPLLSHAAILHNSNRPFIPLPLPQHLMCLLIFFLLLAPSFSFHTVPAFPPLQICVASRTLHFHHITFICIPLLSSSLPVLFAFFHLPVQMAIVFTASLPLSICNPNIFYNPRREGKRCPSWCLSPSRDIKPCQCLCVRIHRFKNSAGWMTDWWRSHRN